jgi:hypothetical protein
VLYPDPTQEWLDSGDKKMKSIPSILIGLSLSMPAVARPTPLDVLQAEACDKTLQALAQSYLTENSILLSIYEDQTDSHRRLALETLELCQSLDLDPGSYKLRRETTFCNKTGDTITLYTFGDFYCDGEKVLGIKSLKLTRLSAKS